jgi:hypothetical protein
LAVRTWIIAGDLMGKLLGDESWSDSQEINEREVAFDGKAVNPPIARDLLRTPDGLLQWSENALTPGELIKWQL